MAADAVALPEGFTLDKPTAPALPPGFTLDQSPAQAPAPTFANRAGQFASGINSGLAQTADLVLDAPSRVLALAHGIATGGMKDTPPGLQAPHFAQRAMTDIGMNPPVSLDDYIGGLLHRVGEFTGSAALPIGRVESAAKYAVQLGTGALAGTTAVGAKEAAKSLGAGETGQNIAEMAGALTPAGVAAGTSALTQKVLRGGSTPQQIAANAAEIKTATGGVPATVGQATGSMAAQGVENTLAKVPISGLPVLRRAQEQTDAIGDSIAQMSRNLSTVRDKPAVGAAIQRGLSDFVESASGKFASLDNTLKAMFSPGQKFQLTNTEDALAKLSKVSPDLPEFSASLKDPNIKNWYDRLRVDTSGTPAQQVSTGVLNAAGQPITKTIPGQPFQGVSMQTLMDVRSDIGTNIKQQTLLGKKPDAQYDKIYNAISNDINAAVKGTPAEAAFARRNNYWKSFRGRVDDFLDHIAVNPNKTESYLDTLSGANVGREQILAVRRSVDPEVWKSVASAKLAQMGQDTKLGTFSLQKFVTEYRKMADKPVGSNALSPADALFGGIGDVKANLDKIADASQKIISAGKVYQNPSGTSTATTAIAGGAALATTVFGQLMRGELAGAAIELGGAATVMGGSRYLANVMTNPKTVEWLANSTKVPADQAAQYLKRLTPIISDITDARQKAAIQAWRDEAQKRLAVPAAMQGVRG